LGYPELHLFQRMLLANPHAGPVIQGTGGLRKVRFAPRILGRGKRGGLRVLYVYFESYSVVVLVKAYAKNVKDDLDVAEKQAIRGLVNRISAEIGRRFTTNGKPSDGNGRQTR
jgi:hypothetical protein